MNRIMSMLSLWSLYYYIIIIMFYYTSSLIISLYYIIIMLFYYYIIIISLYYYIIIITVLFDIAISLYFYIRNLHPWTLTISISPSPPRANSNPILPPYLIPHSARELKPYTPPLPSPSAHLKDKVFIKPWFYHPKARGFIKPLVLTSHSFAHPPVVRFVQKNFITNKTL